MATFKAEVQNRRSDGTYNVRIRITHNRQIKRISTNIYATDKDLTRSLKIKNENIISQTTNLIQHWRSIVNQLGLNIENMTVDGIVDYIKNKELNGDIFQLDIIAYGHKVASKKSAGTATNYTAMLNCLCRYVKSDTLDISIITAKFLDDFEYYIANEPVYNYSSKKGVTATNQTKGGRAISLYLSCLRHIHNEAKKEYNQEDIGVILIPQSPFLKYKVKKVPRTRKRAVEIELIQSIVNLPDFTFKTAEGDNNRRDLARDCFLLSFALAGMNAIDIFYCPAQKFKKTEKIIIYNRRKTESRRDDGAEMKIRIEPCIETLIQKYSDPTGERLFCFHKSYKDSKSFNTALSRGLDQVEKAIEAESHFTFYSARHSWATIGRSNKVNIDKYTIHEGLNHVDAEMKITDIYAEKDYRNIWEANAKILALFDWNKQEGDE